MKAGPVEVGEAPAHEEGADGPAEVGAALALLDEPTEDFIEAFAALHQDDLNLPLIFSDAVGDPILGVAELEVMRAQPLEGGMEGRGGIR